MKRHTPAWLESAVFYEIYPQSFSDTNGDGIGDIPGIIDKLEYIKSLGVNAIWLNPCFVSPFMDAGYDVADYYTVAPRYGTNSDLKRLFRLAREKGIRIFLDLVPGHTSIEHPWFKESCKHERNRYSDWFIWSPNVWTGGKQYIHGYAERDGNYMINFFWCQPKLNFGFDKPSKDEPWRQLHSAPGPTAVRAEFKKIIRYWLDMGASGFRVDMALSLGTAFWKEVRAMLDKEYPDAALVSEASNPDRSIPVGFHMDFLAHFGCPVFNALMRSNITYNVPWKMNGAYFSRHAKGDAKRALDEYMRLYRTTKSMGFLSLQSSNHDMPRLRDDRTFDECAVALAFIMTMPGVPFLYYGDEIGMKDVKGLVSKEGAYNRASCRTPMQWDSSKNAGFSTAAPDKLYFPIDPDRNRPTVAAQDATQRSLLNTTRALTALRKSSPALCASGSLEFLYLKRETYPLVYLRSKGRERILVAVNPSGRSAAAAFTLPKTSRVQKLLLGKDAKLGIKGRKAMLTLAPTAYAIYAI
ncbi:glycosylase [bacterium]|nr:glycosylase [bacterium]